MSPFLIFFLKNENADFPPRPQNYTRKRVFGIQVAKGSSFYKKVAVFLIPDTGKSDTPINRVVERFFGTFTKKVAKWFLQKCYPDKPRG